MPNAKDSTPDAPRTQPHGGSEMVRTYLGPPEPPSEFSRLGLALGLKGLITLRCDRDGRWTVLHGDDRAPTHMFTMDDGLVSSRVPTTVVPGLTRSSRVTIKAILAVVEGEGWSGRRSRRGGAGGTVRIADQAGGELPPPGITPAAKPWPHPWRPQMRTLPVPDMRPEPQPALMVYEVVAGGLRCIDADARPLLRVVDPSDPRNQPDLDDDATKGALKGMVGKASGRKWYALSPVADVDDNTLWYELVTEQTYATEGAAYVAALDHLARAKMGRTLDRLVDWTADVDLTGEEVDEELRAEGIDPETCVADVLRRVEGASVSRLMGGFKRAVAAERAKP